MNTDKMTCGEAREKLLLYVGGDLDADILEAVAVHLERCDECARKAEAGMRARRSLVSALHERQEGARQPSLWPGIRSTLLAEGILHEPMANPVLRPLAPLGPRRARWTLALVPLAAAAALLLVTEWSGSFRSTGGGRILPNPRTAEIHEAQAGIPEVAFTPPSDAAVTPESSRNAPVRLRRLAPGEVEPLRAFAPAQSRGAGGEASLAGFNGRVK